MLQRGGDKIQEAEGGWGEGWVKEGGEGEGWGKGEGEGKGEDKRR